MSGNANGRKVAVTTDVIEQSIRADSGHCMIADAIKQQIPGASRVSVDLQTIRFSDRKKGLRYIYLTPPECQAALVNFDQGIDPEPFTFQLLARKASTTPIRAASKKANETAKRKRPTAAGKTEIVDAANGAAMFVRRGGAQPPVAVLAHDVQRGRIRSFGVRNLGPRLKDPAVVTQPEPDVAELRRRMAEIQQMLESLTA